MAGNLILVLGDQLDRGSAAFDGFDRRRDRVWMAEVAEESTHVWTHKARIAVFLAAMRHFRAALTQERIDVDYAELAAAAPAPAREPKTLATALHMSLARLKKEGFVPSPAVEPAQAVSPVTAIDDGTRSVLVGGEPTLAAPAAGEQPIEPIELLPPPSAK